MPRYLFVTGRLAAQSLADTLKSIAGLDYEIAVLPISVAALMDTRFAAKHLACGHGCEKVMLPGLCPGDLGPVAEKTGVEVMRGPKSLKDLPVFFGAPRTMEGYGERRARILAEIVDAYKMSTEEVLSRASYFRNSGADIIDLGCPVDRAFPGIGETVGALKKAGFLVSVDSFSPEDISQADQAGADLVLSIDSRNMDLARRLRSKVVVIPDSEQGLESLERNIAQLEAWHVPYIIDPVLKPIGFGMAESIGNFIRIRREHPDVEMLIGLGNVTELTDADTTGMNAVMAGIVEELGIDYILTTEVISWARGAVRELDLARQLMHYAHKNRLLPKHLNDGLITVKDPPFETFSEEELRGMQAKISDSNFRILPIANSSTSLITVFLSRTRISNLFLTGSELRKPRRPFISAGNCRRRGSP